MDAAVNRAYLPPFMSDLPALTDHVRSGATLAPQQVALAAHALLEDSAEDESKAAFLEALAARGESPAEIAEFVRQFLQRAVPVPLDLAALDRPAIDVCGTGGDRLGLINVSTTSVFIIAAAGAAVVKHGNRGITSPSGSADVLEAAGGRIDLPPERFAESIRATGVGFMLAPQYHPAFRAVAPVRKTLAARGVRSIFNIIGPLLNPTQPPFQLAGVHDRRLVRTYAEIMTGLGRRRAWAVHGTTQDGSAVDELSTLGPTHIVKAEEGTLTEIALEPPASLPRPESVHQLKGGSPAVNASLLEGILRGEVRGPKRDLVILNAAAAIVVAGLSPGVDEACALAEEKIDSRQAAAVFDRWRAFA